MSDKKNAVPALTSEKVNAPIFALPEGCDNDKFKSILDDVLTKRIDANKPIPEPELLIGMNNAPILRRGGLCFVCGKAGSRKTSALTLLCADAMRPGYIEKSPFSIPRPLRVLYIDPEQHEGDTQWINQRIVKLIGDDKAIDTYPLISYPTNLLPCIVEALMTSGKYDICIVDNIAQLGKGIVMDIDKAEELVRNLRRLAVVSNCGFIGVIHMNEGSDTKRPRGHGGAEAVREGDLVLQFIEDVNEECSMAEAIKARKMKPGKWCIAIDANGIPYYRDLPEAPANRSNPDKYVEIVAKIPLNGMTFTELQNLVVEVAHKAKSTARDWVCRMERDKVIVKVDGRYYHPENSPKEVDNNLPF